MFILGIFSLVQIVLLPGLISLRLVRFRGTFWQSVVYTFALSLLINYCVVFLLTALNLYSRPLILTLFAIQVIWVVWLYRDTLRSPVIAVFQDLMDRSFSSLARLFPVPAFDLSILQKTVHYVFLLFTLISLVFALERIWWSCGVFLDNIGTVFGGWDAVYSWNRWAGVWFGGRMPLDSRFYPQLMPVNWSLTYVFIGDSSLQLFAKSMMPLFVIGVFLQLFDLGITFRQPGFFVALILLRALFVRFIDAGIHNGYVDTAVAFFALLTVYTILKAQRAEIEPERQVLCGLGVCFAAAASVTKQAGVFIFPIYLFLVYLFVLRPNYGNRLNPTIWRSVLIWGAFAALVPLSWYGYKAALIFLGVDEAEILANAGIAAQAYGNAVPVSQIAQALTKFGVFLYLFPLILGALPLLPSLVRWLFFLIVLPFPIIWAMLASYDTRNLAISLPILALAGGLAMEATIRFALRLLARSKIEKWAVTLAPAVLVIIIFGLAFSYPEERIRTEDMTARQELFSPSLNRELQRLFSENPSALILTAYPVDYVLGLENSQVLFWYADTEEFKRLMENEKLTHLLVPSTADNAEIWRQIEQWVDEGHLSFMLQDQGTTIIPYRLYAIRR